MKISLLILFFGLCQNPANAANEAGLGHDLTGLLNYAREHNPELVATRFEAEAAQQRVAPAGALPDPVLRTEMFDITRQGTNSPNLQPGQGAGTRYLLTQSVPWYGKRDLQRTLALTQVDQASGKTAASWADLAGSIKSGYALDYYLAGSERLIQRTLGLFDGLEKIVTTRYANGLVVQQDVIRVQVETTNLRNEIIALENERHHVHAQLNNLLSRPVNAALAEPVQLPALPPAAKLDEAQLLERLHARNPQLQIAEAQIQSADKSRALTYANRYPNFNLGVAPTQSGSMVKSWDLMVELNIPLQQSSRRSQEREAEAMLAAANARKQSALNQVESSLSENLSALEAARRTETLLTTRLLPQSELTYQSALAGYETGKVDFTTLIDAQRQVLQAQQQQLKAQLDAQSRLADIETLMGEEL